MKCDKQTMLLYAVTDRAWLGKQTLYEQVESALKGGATCVQLREKHLGDEDFLREAIEIHALCQRYGVPLLAKMPIDPALAKLTDDGCIEQFEGHWLDGVVETLLRK